MISAFITLRILDIIDIFLVAFLIYQLYLLIRGTVAMNIFIGIFSIYLFWLVVKALNMHLLGSILGQIIGVGVIALIVVFQQEIRRFLLIIGSKYFSRKISLDNLFSWNIDTTPTVKIKSVLKACVNLSKSNTGALIVIARKSILDMYSETGDILDANTSSRLIEAIFSKNSPLHDGAIIIVNEKIIAARCILPVSESMKLPPDYGLRHRAALGMSENNDSLIIVVSEETGQISVADGGSLQHNVSARDLMSKLEQEFA